MHLFQLRASCPAVLPLRDLRTVCQFPLHGAPEPHQLGKDKHPSDLPARQLDRRIAAAREQRAGRSRRLSRHDDRDTITRSLQEPIILAHVELRVFAGRLIIKSLSGGAIDQGRIENNQWSLDTPK